MNLFAELKRRVQTVRHGGEARAAYFEGRIPDALAHAQMLHGLNQANPWASFRLACQHLEGERYADALPYLEHVARDWPSEPWAYYALGVCHDHLDQPRKAIPFYEYALQIDPGWVKALKHLGRNLYLVGNYAKSEEVLLRCCELSPDDKEVHDLLGYLCYRLGQYTRSFGHYERAHHLDPLNTKLDRNARLLYTRSARS